MNDWTKITTTCPACKSTLKVRVEVDFDAEVDLECEGAESFEGLFNPTERDENGRAKKPLQGMEPYKALIPNIESFGGLSPEGVATVEGEKRPCFVSSHAFLLDRVPFLFKPDPIFKDHEGKDWTDGTIKKQFDPASGPFHDVVPCETGNALVAMRFDDGGKEVACYLPRNQVDLFCIAYPGCTFHHQFNSSKCVIVRDMDTGKAVGGIMPLSR